MGRTAKPWYRKHDGWWYATITPGARPEKLAKGRGAQNLASQRFAELTHSGRRPYDLRSTQDLVSVFLEHVQASKKSRTYDNYADLLSAFCKYYGQVRVCELSANHAEAFLKKQETKKERKVTREITGNDGNPVLVKRGTRKGQPRRCTVTLKPWSKNRSATFAAVLKACFNWGVKAKYITEHPFDAIDRPFVATKERIFTEEEFQQLVSATDHFFGDFLTALRQTGCRPSEVASVTAEQVDTKNWCWVFREHKTDRTRNLKVVWLTETMIEMTRKLTEEHLEGPLFRNSRGNPWNHSSIAHKFRNLRQKLGFSEDAIPYAFRHTFITDALEREVPLATVATLVSHKSPQMIQRRYGHLVKKSDYLRSALKKATTQDSVECAAEDRSSGHDQDNPPNAPR